jgi:CRP/FNR family transcriptional regulator, cyclic AMP receptor protein
VAIATVEARHRRDVHALAAAPSEGAGMTTSSPGFLSTLEAYDRDALALRWSTRTYKRDETILAHDEAGRDVFFVLEGRARATIYSENGRAVAYRDIEPGDIFGELAAIDGGARSASVVALTDMIAARLSRSAFRELVTTHPSFTWGLLRHLSAQMRRMTERIHEFSTLVVRKRLVRELLRLAGDDGKSAKDLIIEPAPTHFDLAAKISTHREAVSRQMSALTKRGLVTKQGGRLLLRGIETLRALVETYD